jgi:hypothetical protein
MSLGMKIVSENFNPTTLDYILYVMNFVKCTFMIL